MNKEEVYSLLRPNICTLIPYSTARDEFKGSLGVFLDANESPYGTGWNRYPDPRQEALKAAIGKIRGIAPEHIFVGNGSDEAIDLVFRLFCIPGKDNVVCIEPSYGMYAVAAAINDVEVRPVRLGRDFSLPAEKILEACDDNTKAIFLCTPNNPSGNAFSNEEVLGIVHGFKGMVVVDEAYIDFCSVPSLLKHIGSEANLMVLQTLSKARGLAALRVGLAFSDEMVSAYMARVKYPYNINAAAQKLALEELSKPIDAIVSEIIAQRSRISAALEGFSMIRKVYPSEANFILVETDDADRLYNHLIADGIIVRNRTRIAGCTNCLRITVGLPEENDKLLKSLKDYEEGNIRG